LHWMCCSALQSVSVWWWLLLSSLLQKQCSICVWNSLVLSYLASHSEWRCLRCLSFCRWWKTENIHVDLTLLVWSPTILSTHDPLLSPFTPSFFFPSFFFNSFCLFSFSSFCLFPLFSFFSSLFFLFVLFCFVCVCLYACVCVFGHSFTVWQ